jgi:hypothetical protein
MWRRVGTVLLTICAVSAVPAARADEGDVIGLPDSAFSDDDLAATSAPPPDSPVDRERRLLALGVDQGLHRRPPQRIDTPAWMRPPFEGAVLALAGEDFPFGGPPPESIDIILMSSPTP